MTDDTPTTVTLPAGVWHVVLRALTAHGHRLVRRRADGKDNNQVHTNAFHAVEIASRAVATAIDAPDNRVFCVPSWIKQPDQPLVDASTTEPLRFAPVNCYRD